MSFLTGTISIDSKTILPVSYNFFSSVTLSSFVIFSLISEVNIKVAQVALVPSLFHSSTTILPVSNFKVHQSASPSNNHGGGIFITTEEIHFKWLELKHEVPLFPFSWSVRKNDEIILRLSFYVGTFSQ